MPLWQARVPNAVISIGTYLWETVAPIALHPAHQHPGAAGISLGAPMASMIAIVAVAAVGLRLRRAVPACAAGLAWFFIALLPVLGLVKQQGFQARADRFTYIPHIGLMVAVVWTAAYLLARWRASRHASAFLAAAAIAGCILLDWRQIGIWHDSISLWNHVLVHEPTSALAHMCLGEEWHDRGQMDRAEAEFRASLAIRDNERARDWLGLTLSEKGRLAEAYEQHAAATRLAPAFWEAHNNAGIALARMGRMEEALARFEQAAAIAPGDPDVQRHAAQARAEIMRAKHFPGR